MTKLNCKVKGLVLNLIVLFCATLLACQSADDRRSGTLVFDKDTYVAERLISLDQYLRKSHTDEAKGQTLVENMLAMDRFAAIDSCWAWLLRVCPGNRPQLVIESAPTTGYVYRFRSLAICGDSLLAFDYILPDTSLPWKYRLHGVQVKTEYLTMLDTALSALVSAGSSEEAYDGPDTGELVFITAVNRTDSVQVIVPNLLGSMSMESEPAQSLAHLAAEAFSLHQSANP